MLSGFTSDMSIPLSQCVYLSISSRIAYFWFGKKKTFCNERIQELLIYFAKAHLFPQNGYTTQTKMFTEIKNHGSNPWYINLCYQRAQNTVLTLVNMCIYELSLFAF